LPNPWDQGSARLLAWLGFEALATTSSGFAATLGRLDGSVTRDEALAHAAAIVGATDLPVSADLENGFAHDPDGVATTVRLALEAGLAGCSVEDATGRPDDPICDAGLASERVRAAAEAAHRGPVRLVSVGRAFAAVGAVVEAATELREAGTYGFWQHASTGRTAAGFAFGGRDLEA
jgi:2-methylisocitrate lyase-like PEP mutase family enzyme